MIDATSKEQVIRYKKFMKYLTKEDLVDIICSSAIMTRNLEHQITRKLGRIVDQKIDAMEKIKLVDQASFNRYNKAEKEYKKWEKILDEWCGLK